MLGRGQKGEQQPQHYNILLFGQTGHGKSTLVNYLTNYFLDGSLENMKIAIQTKYRKATERWKSNEKDINDSMKSKTSECTVYDFIEKGLHFNFIDTPGLSDTAGTEQDDRHIENIMSFAEKTGTLCCIIIVINGSEARATANIRNTLVRLRGSVPDALLNNLLVVLTNCDFASANFDLKSLKPWIVAKNNIFHMQNSALSKPEKEWMNDPKLKKGISDHWEVSMEEIGGMIKRIKQLGHVTTTEFREMLLQREQIKAELHGSLLEVKKLQRLQDELGFASLAQQDITTDIQKYSNYKHTKQVEYEELVPADYHSTICTLHSKACHERCTLEYTSNPGEDIFKLCWCMQGPNCKMCGCDHKQHYHDMKKVAKYTKTVEDIVEHEKTLYDHYIKKQTDLREKISSLYYDLVVLRHALKRKEANIHESCQKLKKICSQFNFVAELQGVIDTMKLHARTITSVNARKEADTMIENITYLANELSQSHRSTCAAETGEDETPATQNKPATDESEIPLANPDPVIRKMTSPKDPNSKILQNGPCAFETGEDATPATHDKPVTEEIEKPQANPEPVIRKMTTEEDRKTKILHDDPCAFETGEDATPATHDKPVTEESEKPQANPEPVIRKMTTEEDRKTKILHDGPCAFETGEDATPATHDKPLTEESEKPQANPEPVIRKMMTEEDRNTKILHDGFCASETGDDATPAAQEKPVTDWRLTLTLKPRNTLLTKMHH